ncbi:MAG TPA: UDP-2,3-diacylglucosamine diphosphatase LpxI [Rhizobiaceae bacterium]|nr:UDP-2,3-diacylglucosamine diphosphatase LpxI [Rhizobiaceae bacterium]
MTRTERPHFSPNDRVALIAGSGRLPVEVAEALAKQGKAPFVILVEGEASETSTLRGYANTTMAMEDVGRLQSVFRQNNITHAVLAGGISRRPKLWHFKPRLGLIRVIPSVVAGLAGGDNRLLATLVRVFHGFGVKVLGAHEVMPELLASEGVMTRAKPQTSDLRDLDAAWAAAKAIGKLDIGQAAVAIGGRAVELEGIEGTAGLLERARGLRTHGRLAGKKRGVLVKCAKPDQELRADLPSIGPETVDAVHAAGLAGIGVEADRSLILDSAETIARANRLGVFIVGLGQDGK